MLTTLDSETTPPAAPKPRRRVFQNTVFSILSKTQSAAFSYVSLRLVLAAMTVEDYGFYTLLFVATLQNLSLLVQLGVPSFLTRFVPEFFTQAKYRMIGRLFRTASLLQTAFACLLLLIVLVFASKISALLNFPGDENDLRIFSIGALAYLISENYRTVLSCMFKQHAVFWVTFIYNVLRLAAIYFVTQFMFSLFAIVVAEVVMLALGVIFFVVAYQRTLRPLIALDHHPPEPIPWRRYLRYTGLVYLNGVGVLVLGGLDLFFVTGLLGATAVGLYGLASRILMLMNGVMPSILLKSMIEPFFYSEFGSAGKKSMEAGFSMLTKLISFVTVPTAIWLALMSGPIIVHLFDPKYAAASGILIITAFNLLMINLKLPVGLVLLAAERVDLLIYVKILGVFKIVAAVVLLPLGDIVTMAWITFVSSVLEILFMYYFVVRKVEIVGDLKGMAKLAINGGVTALVFLPINSLFTGLAGVLLSVPFVAAVFLIMCFINKPFSTKERDWVNRHLKRPVWVF